LDNADDANAFPANMSQEEQQAVAKSPSTHIIASKVGGDTSPYMTSNQASTLCEELKVFEEGNKKVTKQVAFDGKHAMYVVSKALLKKLELDEDQESSKTPADHYVHIELSDGTVLAGRPFKTHQQCFAALRTRREQSLAAHAANAGSSQA
jgi:hypothetical protein